MVFSLETQYFSRPSQSVSLMIEMNSLLLRKVVPGLSTTAKISSRPRIFERMVKVFIILDCPLPMLPDAPPLPETSLRQSLQILLKTIKASVKYLLASSVLKKLGNPSSKGAEIESKRFMCFCLHSNEQTGWRVSLQYRLACPLQTIHQPNFPAATPCSFLIST